METTRRTLFAGAAGLAVVAAAAPALAAERPIADLWREAVEIRTYLDRDALADDDVAMSRMFELENATLLGPIRTRADALAKLKCSGLALERGERLDGKDEPAFKEAVLWLETH